MTIGLLNTNYTDFSDTPIFSKKNSAYNYSKNAQLSNLHVNYYNDNSTCSKLQSYIKQFPNKAKTKKSRNQEIQYEIEQNSLIQLNMVMQMENYPLRNDYIISIISYLAFTIFMFWLSDLVLYVENFEM